MSDNVKINVDTAREVVQIKVQSSDSYEIPAIQRKFRTLDDGNAVTYADGGIGYNGPDQWVSLPTPDEAKIGAAFLFYGYDSNGYVNGFYSNDGDVIIAPDSPTPRGWFAVPSRASVMAQLSEAGNWLVTVLDAGVTNIPYCTGEFGLNVTDGSNFYIGYLYNDTLIGINGGRDGARMQVSIGYTSGTPQLTFDSSIKLRNNASPGPIDLDVWRSYSFRCLFRGGYQTLDGNLEGPTVESED